MPVTVAEPQDITEIVQLINSAYRGESSKKGWTTEADLLEGEIRTDVSSLRELLEKTSSRILIYKDSSGEIIGSVYLDIQEKGLYLGMLTVSPPKQAGGIGKKLMLAAENWARRNSCPCIFMNVIPLRTELVDWYERLGYSKTGEIKPYSADERYGKPTRHIEFAIMQKEIR